MSEKPEALADRLDDERMNLIERLADENERLREEVRNWKKSFAGHVYVKTEDYAELVGKRDALKAEIERLLEALAWAYNLRHLRGHSDPVVIPERFAPLIDAALRRERT